MGRKRVKTVIAAIILVIMLIPALQRRTFGAAKKNDSAQTKPWTRQKAWNWYKSIEAIRGCNYLPRTAVNSTEMWQADTFDPNTIAQELAWARNAGYNSIRVFLQYVVWKAEPEKFKKRIDEFLAIAAKNGISVMLIPFCDCAFAGKEPYIGKQNDPVPGVHNSQWVPSPGRTRVVDRSAWPDLERYIKDIVGTFAKDRRVLIWDLYNEPGNSGMRDKSLPLVAETFKWARAANPSQPLTVAFWGSFDSKASKLFVAFSDIVSFHAYGAPKSVEIAIKQCQALGRPMICSEWLRRQVGNDFAGILPLFAQHKVGWYHWGLVAGRTQTYFHWGSRKDSAPPKLWQHDIFHPDGTPYSTQEIELIKKFKFDE